MYRLSKFFKIFFKEVFPELPVIAKISALELALFSLANLFRKFIGSGTLIIFLVFLLFFELIMRLAPFFIAFETNLFPSLFFPLIAKNKLFYLVNLFLSR